MVFQNCFLPLLFSGNYRKRLVLAAGPRKKDLKIE